VARLQTVVADPTAPGGLAFTNGVLGVVR